MRKVLFFFATLFVIFSAYGQQNSELPHTADYYLQKSFKQRKTGKTLLLGGLGMTIAGGAIFTLGWDNDQEALATIGGGLFLAGIASDIACIPFYIAAGENKKKAASLSLQIQKNDLPSGPNTVREGQITLRLQLNL